MLLKASDIEPVLWRKVFEPGYVALEALERMLVDCCAAVFVATPDDAAHIRGCDVKTPRANVMLEFGLVAGRLGLHNIALCQYDPAVLPSDLKGLTVIPMTPPPDSSREAAAAFKKAAEHQLRTWASRLICTVPMIPRMEVVHGYTGRWDLNVRLKRWRGLPIERPGFAQVNGGFDLLVMPNGQTGRGIIHGRLTFKIITQGRKKQAVYEGEFRVSHEIDNVMCSNHGALSFTSRVFVAHLMTSSGTPPRELAGLAEPPEAWPFSWVLHPTDRPRTLEGTLEVDMGGDMTTEGTVSAVNEAFRS